MSESIKIDEQKKLKIENGQMDGRAFGLRDWQGNEFVIICANDQRLEDLKTINLNVPILNDGYIYPVKIFFDRKPIERLISAARLVVDNPEQIYLLELAIKELDR